MAHYDDKLWRAEQPLTAEQIGEIVGCYGPDAVHRLRIRSDLYVEVVGSEPSGNKEYRRKLYRVHSATSEWAGSYGGTTDD